MILRVLLSIAFFAASAAAQLRPTGQARPNEAAPAAAQESDASALGALKLLPKDAAPRLARIEGREGRPFPERWYVLIHDAGQPRGLREFVVSQGKLVTGRTLSQFADALSAEDVVGASTVKMNSDEAAGVAAQFAMHNGKQLATVNYELVKATAPPVPVWRLTCFGTTGELLGKIVLHATKGTLLSFDGFEKSPIVPEPEIASNPEPVRPESASRSPGNKPKPKTTSRATPPPRGVPVQTERRRKDDGIGGFFRRVFRD